MSWIFSKRCSQALRDGKIKVSIPSVVRNRLLKAFGQYNEAGLRTTETGFNYNTSTLEELPEQIKAELGCEHLMSYPSTESKHPEPGNFDRFVLRGNYPPHLFDAAELFYAGSFGNKFDFQTAFNNIMEESAQHWRMADGKIFPVDSSYVDEEIIRRSYQLLHEAKFLGALQEFEKARAHLANGSHEEAISNANLALESVIKGILKVDKAKPGVLFEKLIKSGIIPEYFSGFLKSFESDVLRSVAKIRNEERGVGHGRGIAPKEIPKTLAELAVNMSAVLINYLIKFHLETNSQPPAQVDTTEVPF